MDQQMGGWASGLMVKKWINEQMEVNGWRDGCLDEWMIEWTVMDRQWIQEWMMD